jgi:hypothetical protein
MDSHPVFSANLPGVHFQDPSGLDHCQPPTGWNSNSGFAMIDQGLTLSPTQLFDLPLGFHNLPGTNLPNDVANTLPNSFSVDIGLPSPKNTKVLSKEVLNSSPQCSLLFSKAVLTHPSDELRIEPRKKPSDSVKWTISVPWNNS